MSDSASIDQIPDDIGRNDPCPCGSGRKYKKCCQRAHRLQKESAKKSNTPDRLITAETIPWEVVGVLRQIHDNNAFGLFFELAHDEGPFRERYADKSSFVGDVDTGEQILPASKAFEFAHMRLDGPDTYLLFREDDPKRGDVDFQIVTLRKNEVDANGDERSVDHEGYRIWDFQRHRVDRDDVDGVPPLETFDIEWRSE